MMVAIRAIYHNGQLQLLDPVDLEEGQEVQVQILDKQSSLKDLIGDMLVQFDVEASELDEEAILREIAEATKGKRPLSEIIIEERQD